jgi:hypothetical protein
LNMGISSIPSVSVAGFLLGAPLSGRLDQRLGVIGRSRGSARAPVSSTFLKRQVLGGRHC